MSYPEPQLGLVVSYSYLWHHERRAGRVEGLKDRPCVIVLAVKPAATGGITVRVVPVTHREPEDLDAALELPIAVKRHLGLDLARSWAILDEINEFAWPGFDLRPVTRGGARFDYGLIPPRLFEQIMTKLQAVWEAGRGKKAFRD